MLRAPGIGAVRFAKLVEHCGAATQALAAGRKVWEQLELPAAAVTYLQAPDWSGVERDLLRKIADTTEGTCGRCTNQVKGMCQLLGCTVGLRDAGCQGFLERIPAPVPRGIGWELPN